MKWKNNHQPKKKWQKKNADRIIAKAAQLKKRKQEKSNRDNFVGPVPFRFQGKTYKQIAEKAQLDFEYLRRLIKSKYSSLEVKETTIVNNLGWSRIRKVVCGTWGSNQPSKPKEQRNIAKSTMPLTKYKGGNSGKIIYTGQTN